MYNLSTIGFKIMYGVISMLLKIFNLNINMDNYNDTLKSGDIFVFNHFTRSETALPQYILYCADPTIRCYAVAHASLFKVPVLGGLISRLGAVPHNHPNLMVLLTEKLSQGYKVVIFPQGKMVKDHQDMDMKTGSAVLALGADIYKRHIRNNEQDYSAELVKFSNTPTVIVPCNISYYPLRVEPNKLTKLGKRAGLPNTMIEELTVEGNIILRDTDMNLKFGEPITIDSEHISIDGIESIKDCFEMLKPHREDRFKIKDDYNEEIYKSLVLNQGHVFSEILFNFYNQGMFEISKYQLLSAVDIACGDLDIEFKDHDHNRLVELSIKCGLISDLNHTFKISPRLEKEQPFKFVRMSNPLKVYTNELSPMTEAKEIIAKAIDGSSRVAKRGFILRPTEDADIGESVMVIHGLFANADQCRPLAEELQDKGYTVYVPLIAGHGTNKEDLSKRTRQDWYDSITASVPKEKFHVVGFSTGGLIAAKLADEFDVLSLIAICAPHKLVSKGMNFAKVIRAIKFPKFIGNIDNPETYDSMPVNTLCELIDLIEETKRIFRKISVKSLVVQTSNDPIVDPESGVEILNLIGDNVDLHIIPSDEHNINVSKDVVIQFIGEVNA